MKHLVKKPYYIFQWIDHGHWYDRKDTSKLELLDVLLVCALSPPGCGRNDVSNRFIRHMNILGIDSFDDETLRRIFTTEVDWHFKVRSYFVCFNIFLHISGTRNLQVHLGSLYWSETFIKTKV